MVFGRREFLLVSAAALGGCVTSRRHRLGAYPGWRSGELDIHFIHTGVGEQTFFIFPDGTTMLLDCGDFYRPEYLHQVPPHPSMDRLGGEWVSRYVSRLIPCRRIDYFVLTHWHSDHCGGPDLRCETTRDGRRVCGVTRFAEDFDIGHYIDHQYPDRGSYVQPLDPDSMDVDAFRMIQDWIPYMQRRCGMRPEGFRVGAANQIRMLGQDVGRFADAFSIRNLHANGCYVDKKGNVVDYSSRYQKDHPDRTAIWENSLSLGFRIDYGGFGAYFGGDIDDPGYENALADVIGPVDVFKTNHHSCPSSMGRKVCAALRARLYLSSTWSPNQIADTNLVNMSSRDLYPGERFISFGCLPEGRRREYLVRNFMEDILPAQGHTVVKVAPGGAAWEFFVLSSEDESMGVLYRSGSFVNE